MPIRFNCHRCSARVKAEDGDVGQTMMCPCGCWLKVPAKSTRLVADNPLPSEAPPAKNADQSSIFVKAAAAVLVCLILYCSIAVCLSFGASRGRESEYDRELALHRFENLCTAELGKTCASHAQGHSSRSNFEEQLRETANAHPGGIFARERAAILLRKLEASPLFDSRAEALTLANMCGDELEAALGRLNKAKAADEAAAKLKKPASR